MRACIKTKEACTGCAACAAICPVNAIFMQEDEKGFKYPYVEESICINCGVCTAICPQEKNMKASEMPEIYALKHNNNSTIALSTSGGAFTAFSDVILNEGGSIYGASYNKDFSVSHIKAVSEEKRNLMRGSKYVKSNIGTQIYDAVKKDLGKGKKVLYTGCPCQIAALLSFLGEKHENLVTVDIICHGTPNGLLWQEYLKIIEQKTKRKIGRVRFRSKATGWHNSELRIYDKKGNLFPTHISVYWTKLFLKHYAHYPACYQCQYCDYHRVSDLTMADFWGIEKTKPEIDDDKGISLVFVNTPKGKELFDKIEKDVSVYKSDSESCLQAHLFKPPKKPQDYEQFWTDYQNFGIGFVMKKYAGFNVFKYYTKRVIKWILGKK